MKNKKIRRKIPTTCEFSVFLKNGVSTSTTYNKYTCAISNELSNGKLSKFTETKKHSPNHWPLAHAHAPRAKKSLHELHFPQREVPSNRGRLHTAHSRTGPRSAGDRPGPGLTWSQLRRCNHPVHHRLGPRRVSKPNGLSGQPNGLSGDNQSDVLVWLLGELGAAAHLWVSLGKPEGEGLQQGDGADECLQLRHVTARADSRARAEHKDHVIRRRAHLPVNRPPAARVKFVWPRPHPQLTRTLRLAREPRECHDGEIPVSVRKAPTGESDCFARLKSAELKEKIRGGTVEADTLKEERAERGQSAHDVCLARSVEIETECLGRALGLEGRICRKHVEHPRERDRGGVGAR